MDVEDALAFLDPGFDHLSTVVLLEPSRQILGDRVLAEMQQGAMLERLTGVESFQADIQGVWATRQGQVCPGHHLGIGADASPDHLRAGLAFEKPHHLVIVRLGVDFIARFDQQGHILIDSLGKVQALAFGDRFSRLGP